MIIIKVLVFKSYNYYIILYCLVHVILFYFVFFIYVDIKINVNISLTNVVFINYIVKYN